MHRIFALLSSSLVSGDFAKTKLAAVCSKTADVWATEKMETFSSAVKQVRKKRKRTRSYNSGQYFPSFRAGIAFHATRNFRKIKERLQNGRLVSYDGTLHSETVFVSIVFGLHCRISSSTQ